MSGVWAWIEHSNGAIKQIGLEVLGAGRAIADSLGQPLTALVFDLVDRHSSADLVVVFLRHLGTSNDRD